MGGSCLGISAPLFGLGFAMTLVGALLLFMSFRPREDDGRVEYRSAGIIFIGPIPIVLGGRGKWMLIGIAAAVVIAFLVVLTMAQPGSLG
jgi:uncharacterized protein (TIGR00304 family)